MAGRTPLVLCYHSVSDTWRSSLAVSGERLREQLRYLVQRGYQGATLSQIANGEAPQRAVAVTFDDGYRSILERALPVLSELGLPGTVFVPTDFVGSKGPMSWPGIEEWVGTPDEDELTCMTWEELRHLQDEGWEVGSHTRSHPHLPDLDDHALAVELSESRQICSRELGTDCSALAYPYGDYDRRAGEAAQRAGYSVAAALEPGKERAFSWPRVGIYRVDGMQRFRIKTSSAVRLLRATSLAGVFERWRRSRTLPPR
jgi:peptidoglycan/xylan/chitin deacetylase (PgdA/CDA1 family)